MTQIKRYKKWKSATYYGISAFSRRRFTYKSAQQLSENWAVVHNLMPTTFTSNSCKCFNTYWFLLGTFRSTPPNLNETKAGRSFERPNIMFLIMKKNRPKILAVKHKLSAWPLTNFWASFSTQEQLKALQDTSYLLFAFWSRKITNKTVVFIEKKYFLMYKK